MGSLGLHMVVHCIVVMWQSWGCACSLLPFVPLPVLLFGKGGHGQEWAWM